MGTKKAAAKEDVIELVRGLADKIDEASELFVFEPKKCIKILRAAHKRIAPHAVNNNLAQFVADFLDKLQQSCSEKVAFAREIEEYLESGDVNLQDQMEYVKTLADVCVATGRSFEFLIGTCRDFVDARAGRHAKWSRSQAREAKSEVSAERKASARDELQRLLKAQPHTKKTSHLTNMAAKMNPDGTRKYASLGELQRWCRDIKSPP